MKHLSTMCILGALLLTCSSSAAAGDGNVVHVKSWKGSTVDLCDAPGGAVVDRRSAGEMPIGAAEKVSFGWLKMRVGDREYFVAAGQARTDLKLSGLPKCDDLKAASGFAASRGYGDEGCEP